MKNEHVIKLTDVYISLFFGTLLTVILNFKTILRYFYKDDLISFLILDFDLSSKTDQVFDVFDNSNLVATLSTVLIWVVIYIVGYTIFYFIFQESKAIRDEVNISKKYLHPRNMNETNFWKSAMWYVVYPLLVVVFLVVWLVLTLKIFIPFNTSTVLDSLFVSDSLLISILQTLLSVAVLSVAIIGFMILFRLIKSISKFVW